MEELIKQIREQATKLYGSLSPLWRNVVLGAGAALLLGAVILATVFSAGEGYQYAFTNLSAEDSTEASSTLKTAGIPFRLEAGGSALAVPSSKVYDARLVLATAGLPRGGGVGFELFDRGDLGVSEFTQKINLRRAIEGEVARTIGRLAEVRSARIHLTLGEKGLFRDDDKKASATVVLNLRPGRALGERELAGVRHLVASAVPGLPMEAVTVVDGHGTVLTDASFQDAVATFQHKLERDYEQRIVTLLEPAVGSGAVVARVTAALDTAEISANTEVFDPESATLRSARKITQIQTQGEVAAQGGVAGAAANQPQAAAASSTPGNRASNMEDEVRSYEINKTTTKTVARTPRITKLSVAILVDGLNGKPRAETEIVRLGELARRAVGFDAARGDQIDISSALFSRSAEEAPPKVAAIGPREVAAVAVGVVTLVLLAFLLTRGRRKAAEDAAAMPVLTPGARIAELEALQSNAPDPQATLSNRARELAVLDPARAARLLRAWITADYEQQSQREVRANG
jgi:flagellar M-ring protein FliF